MANANYYSAALDELIPRVTQPAPSGNTGIVPPGYTTGGNQAPVPTSPISLSTGGNQQPVPYSGPATGGNQPAVPYTQPSTGGNQQAIPLGGYGNDIVVPPQTGGNQQPVPATAPQTGGNQQPIPLSQGNFGPVQTVQDTLNGFINGEYAQNARQRGLELANQRGLINGNMAAGASQRAALEAVQPFVQESMGFLNNREDRALRQQLQNDAVLQQDWLQSRQFNNQFNANLSMLPVTSSLDMLQNLMQYGLQEPEVYTPQIMSGFSNFFNNNMLSLLKQYFPNSVTTGGY